METIIYDMAVIGGGPAGYTAALYAARAGMRVCVLEMALAGGQMTTTDIIDNYPGFDEGIEGWELGDKMKRSAERFGAVTVQTTVSACQLTGEIKRLETGSGTVSAYTVVIAAGASPKLLGIPDEERLWGRGVHTCAHCDGRFYRGKTAVVIGGGNSAAADALYLARFAEKVYLVHRRDSLRAEQYYKNALSETSVEFLWNKETVRFLGEERMAGIVLRDTQNGTEMSVDCDGVFISIGRQPQTSLFAGQLSLDKNGYIIADESTETNIPGVYAAGDIRTKALRQVITAASDGACAAHAAELYLAASVNTKQ